MSTIPEVNDLRSQLIAEFGRFENGLNGDRSSSLHNIRQQAMSAFERLGFPTPRHEEWKYTNVGPAIRTSYTSAANEPTQLTENDIAPFKLLGADAYTLVFINGVFAEALSTERIDTDGLFIGNLGRLLSERPEIAHNHLARHAQFENDAFTALNTAFIREGACIIAPKGMHVDKPVHIMFIADAQSENRMMQPRNLIIAGANSRVEVVESNHTVGEYSGFINTVTEIGTARDAHVEHYKVQDDGPRSHYIGTTHTVMPEPGTFHSVAVSLGGAIVRNNLRISLDAERCEAYFHGLYAANDKQLIDNHTLVDHRKPNSYSNELYKGILDGRSTGVFNGKIIVQPDAQKTNAFQSNRNILLSDRATINSKPQLEIFADDVKCSHGATSGQLDDEALFYLRARGLSEQTAKAMLLEAFAAEVVDTVTIEALKTALHTKVSQRLRATTSEVDL